MTALCSGKICTIFPEKGALNFWKACTIALEYSTLNGGFQEFNIFDMRENRMEYEANVFAAQASLPDDTIIEYIKRGYDIQQIAKAMHSDINLIALKVDTLNSQGYQFRKQEHRNDFLKYNKQI